mmetsp:Transcript_26167/g.87627  ORF Transcript_26167/g.87627 Transcript_26167/m.87627 type:complete len:240 (+) Transcript_26167:251-970(+)
MFIDTACAPPLHAIALLPLGHGLALQVARRRVARRVIGRAARGRHAHLVGWVRVEEEGKRVAVAWGGAASVADAACPVRLGGGGRRHGSMQHVVPRGHPAVVGHLAEQLPRVDHERPVHLPGAHPACRPGRVEHEPGPGGGEDGDEGRVHVGVDAEAARGRWRIPGEPRAEHGLPEGLVEVARAEAERNRIHREHAAAEALRGCAVGLYRGAEGQAEGRGPGHVVHAHVPRAGLPLDNE